MAVVESLNVVLSLIHQQFSNGAKKAGQDLKNLDNQAHKTAVGIKTLNATMKGIGGIGGKLGLPGAFGGMLGGFTFANFAKDSLQEHAKDNKQLQETLNELDLSFIQIKKNFGAWMVEVAGAEGIIAGFNKSLKNMSGGTLSEGQAKVNKGFLDNFTREDIKRVLPEIEARQASLAAQLRERDDPELQRAFDVGRQEFNVLLNRLNALNRGGTAPEKAVSNLDISALVPFMKTEFGKVSDIAGGVWDGFSKGATTAIGEVQNLSEMVDQKLADLKKKAQDDADQIIMSAKTPFELFNDEFERLKFLKSEGFLTADQAAAGLAGLREGLAGQFSVAAAGPLTGARRGSAEAFGRIDADRRQRENGVENTWEKILERAEEQAKLTKETNKLLAKAFNETTTVDPKP